MKLALLQAIRPSTIELFLPRFVIQVVVAILLRDESPREFWSHCFQTRQLLVWTTIQVILQAKLPQKTSKIILKVAVQRAKTYKSRLISMLSQWWTWFKRTLFPTMKTTFTTKSWASSTRTSHYQQPTWTESVCQEWMTSVRTKIIDQASMETLFRARPRTWLVLIKLG